MQLLMMLLLPLFNFIYSGSGYPLLHINLSPSMQPTRPLSMRKISEEQGRSSLHIPAVIQAIQGRVLPSNLEFAIPNALQRWRVEHSFGPSSSPAPSPTYRGPVISPSSSQSLRPHRHHQHHYHHQERPIAVSPSPSTVSGCDEIICTEPFTSTPFGSPCGCVLPMKVELRLGISPYEFFPLVVELEIEVAAGTYLKQNQVKIMGASVDVQDQGKTVVDINLVPLGEKFDSTTAALNNDRFWQKKMHINATLFGDYDVIYIRYPGLPSSPPLEDSHGPVGSGDHKNPIMADIHGKNQKMNVRTIGIIAFSACVLFLVCLGMFSILLKCKKVGRTSATSGPAVTSSVIKKPGIKSNVSSSMVTSASVSLVSTMATLLLSVETFSLADLEKATEKFSSKRILGKGGFGCVYHGNMEDGTEVAIKLLTSGSENGDREFIGEIEMLSRLHHRNLVKLIGICIEEHTRCLVYELVPNGSVESHLHGIDKIKGPLDWDARLKIALGAARGLAYLHEDSNPRVIHRDFKASNILLEDDFTPKVSDFGMAREATEGNQHISTRVMGTFGYVAPEYAMTGHLLVKSDVYSYGVVLLELLSGRKPVDMSQPPGQENLVTWARSLLTSREGLEQLVDPSLHGNYDFNDMAKVAAIASICVHPEVAQRPFMGEVVQALKLIYNDMDETCVDCCSLKESSDRECEFKGDPGPSDSNWWNAGGITPHLKYGYASSFVTMEHSSGSLEGIDNRPLSTSSFTGEGGPLSMRHSNRSGPLRTVRSKLAFYRLRGSISEHGGLLSRRVWSDSSWV